MNNLIAELDAEYSWYLRSAEQRAIEHDKFLIPDRDERASVVPDQIVQLLFGTTPDIPPPGPRGERMWVEVQSRSGLRYVGRLDSYPYTPAMRSCLRHGDEIEFGPEHISKIWRSPTKQ